MEISKQELKDIVEKNLSTLIDVRPVDSYNFWKLKAKQRGGHIKDAKSLPLK